MHTKNVIITVTLKEASYDVIKDSDLEKIFVDKPGEKEDGLAVEAITAENAIADELRSASEKPETVPSDLKLVEGDVDAGGDENG